MNILIDTHIFIWLATVLKRTNKRHQQILTQDHTFYLSAISIAEIMIKANSSEIALAYYILTIAKETRLKFLDFSYQDTRALKNLPQHHKDPFDRMLIAQSISRGYPLISSDEHFRQYPCQLL